MSDGHELLLADMGCQVMLMERHARRCKLRDLSESLTRTLTWQLCGLLVYNL
jgi:hypothetical protein